MKRLCARPNSRYMMGYVVGFDGFSAPLSFGGSEIEDDCILGR